MNKHPAILIIAVAALWVLFQMVMAKSIWGNTWKQATIFAAIAATVAIIAAIFITLFYKQLGS